MKRLKYILLSMICFILIGVTGFQIFGAISLSVKLSGNIKFRAEDIGAQIFGVYALSSDSAIQPTYISLSGSGDVTDNVYYETGKDYNSSVVTASLGDIAFTGFADTLSIYIFVKNVGSRYIVPNVSITSGSNDVVETHTGYFFDSSEGHVDPVTKKSESASATVLTDTINSEISAGNVGTFTANGSIDNNDTYLLVSSLRLREDYTAGGSSGELTATYNINIEFSADIMYTSDTILSVFQPMGQADPKWTKYGYNATLNATATKVETNSITLLENALSDKDSLGNANIAGIGSGVQVGVDDYALIAPVFKDIDIVNIDIATGEAVGKLSDVNYNFEWYGRSITLPSGTTLASGRTLTTDETFTVDVYTYYPTMYIRRWTIGNEQWISVSDKNFRGAIKIDGYYTATFEATLFNADKTVAINDNGVIARSYNSDYIITNGMPSHLIAHYGYSDSTGTLVNEVYTQTNMLKYCTNLTKAWQDKVTNDPSFANYTIAKMCQGENYKTFIYNLLYLIKYADNNSQAMVGCGNSETYNKYYNNGEGVTLADINGDSISTKLEGSDNSIVYKESIKGSTIGLFNGTNQNAAKMYYGYMSEYQNGNDKQGLYPVQFLTYNTGNVRYLRDGYVGSDKNTAVFCLGQCNPWGNSTTWVFGTTIFSDDVENIYAYVQLRDYDYTTSNYLTTIVNNYEENVTRFTSAGYTKLSYTLPTSSGYPYYYDTSVILTESRLETLIGLPNKQTMNANGSTGVCDYYYGTGPVGTRTPYGLRRGGYASNGAYAGVFCYAVDTALSYSSVAIALRTSLTT